MLRDVLYDRIDRRVDRMIADGLEREARELYPLREYNALQTVGYQGVCSPISKARRAGSRAIELIKRNSRRYAKRQTTWFARNTDTRWFEAEEGCAEKIASYLSGTI